MFLLILLVFVLILRELTRISITSLLIKRVELLRFNRTNATDEEVKEAKLIHKEGKKKVGKRGVLSYSDISKIASSKAVVEKSARVARVQAIELELLKDKNEELEILASLEGLTYIATEKAWSGSKDAELELLAQGVEITNDGGSMLVKGAQGTERAVRGIGAGAATAAGFGGFVTATKVGQGVSNVVGAAFSGGAKVASLGVQMTVGAVKEGIEKLEEVEEKRKQEFIEANSDKYVAMSMDDRARIHSEAVAREHRENEERENATTKGNLIAGSMAWRQKLRSYEASASSLKFLLKILDILSTCLIIGCIALTMIMIIVASTVLIATGSLSVLTGNDTSNKSSSSNVTTSNSSSKDKSGSTSFVGGTTQVPDGIDPKSWSTASEFGQKIASMAISSSVMTLDVPRTKSNGGHLVYQQGNTPVGVYDCSTFVTAVYESQGYLTTGKKHTKNGGSYDFKTQKKSNLEHYMATSQMRGFFASNGSYTVGTLFSGDWESKIKPGDIVLMPGHVVIYVGKNTKGQHVMAHAGSPTSDVFYDTALTKKGKQVGLAPLTNLKYHGGVKTIIRPENVMGK